MKYKFLYIFRFPHLLDKKLLLWHILFIPFVQNEMILLIDSKWEVLLTMEDVKKMLKAAGLNESQQEFCLLPPDESVRLLAPAGAGKTYSLLWRCKCIAEEYKKAGNSEPRFLILTFTQTAKGELEKRIRTREEFHGIKATIKTLNAWGWQQIRLDSNKKLNTTEINRKSLVKITLEKTWKEYSLILLIFTTRKKDRKFKEAIDLIDRLKSLGFEPGMDEDELLEHLDTLKDMGFSLWEDNCLGGVPQFFGEKNANSDKTFYFEYFYNFWEKATEKLESVNECTLEDQKYLAKRLIEDKCRQGNFPKGNARYTHILIDEFQDINPLDMALLKAMYQYYGNSGPISLTICGDDDQAIFGWRGTSPQFILYPEKYFQIDFHTCILNVNYRSPQNIVSYSNKLICHNKNREYKNMISANKNDAVVEVIEANGDLAEVAVELAYNLYKEGDCKQIALIGRKHASIFPCQVLFSADKKQYYVDADIDIYNGEMIGSLGEIVKIIYKAKNDDNDSPCDDILAICDKVYPRPLSKEDKQNLRSYLLKSDPDSFFEALQALKKYPSIIKRDQSVERVVSTIQKLYESETVYDFMNSIQGMDGFKKNYTKKDEDTHYKEPQFYRLAEFSKRYGADFKKFYRDLNATKERGKESRDIESKIESAEDSNIVEGYEEICNIPFHLLTATRSKGREFDAVIILDADSDEWPNERAVKRVDGEEEERRLFYVAMTRAKKYLYFIHSSRKMKSPFLEEAGL